MRLVRRRAVLLSPSIAEQFPAQIPPAPLDLRFIWIPLDVDAPSTSDQKLEAGVLEARPHFTRQIFAIPMEQPDHDCHLPDSDGECKDYVR
jgi:hypothetical protein